MGKGKVKHSVNIQVLAHRNKFVRRSIHSLNTSMFHFDLMAEHIHTQICHRTPRKQHLDNILPHDSLVYGIGMDKGLLLYFHLYKHLIVRRNNQCFHTGCQHIYMSAYRCKCAQICYCNIYRRKNHIVLKHTLILILLDNHNCHEHHNIFPQHCFYNYYYLHIQCNLENQEQFHNHQRQTIFLHQRYHHLAVFDLW